MDRTSRQAKTNIKLKAVVNMYLSIFNKETFINAFFTRVDSTLQRTLSEKSEIVGCSFGKMWILRDLCWGYRIRVMDKIRRFSNLLQVAEFIYTETFCDNYYKSEEELAWEKEKADKRASRGGRTSDSVLPVAQASIS